LVYVDGVDTAMSYFHLTKHELGTLPSKPGDLYNYHAVKKLAYRKNAMGSGFHTRGFTEQKILRKGKWGLDDRYVDHE
jgi:hypothetical protein